MIEKCWGKTQIYTTNIYIYIYIKTFQIFKYNF